MTQQEIQANHVPGMYALENVHGIQPTSNSQRALVLTNLQTLTGSPQTHLTYTLNQPLGNMSSGSFLPFDPRKFISEQTRALGVIQILLGLIHIFSAIKPWWYYWNNPLAQMGYPVWEGISFIISGSLSVYAVKDPSPCVVHGSIGMNVVSSILSLLGLCILMTELFLVSDYWAVSSVSLVPFTLLEFCLTCVVSHLGCQTACCKKDVTVVPVPIVVNVNTVNNASIPASTTSNPASTTSNPASTTASHAYPSYTNCAH